MHHNELAILVACVVLMSICNLAGSLLFIQMTRQVNRARATTAIPAWGRSSPSRILQTVRLHRQIYPSSRLRIIAVALMVSAVLSFLFMMVFLFSHAPHPTSRTTSLLGRKIPWQQQLPESSS